MLKAEASCFSMMIQKIDVYKRQETDYGTFMSMIEKKNIGEVEVKDNQIIFTEKDQKNIYKTGLMNDPNLTDRLYAVSYTHLS